MTEGKLLSFCDHSFFQEEGGGGGVDEFLEGGVVHSETVSRETEILGDGWG